MENGFQYSGQSTTYGAWQSDHWRVIALDSGYESYETDENGHRKIGISIKDTTLLAETDAPQPEAVIEWLKNTVKLGDSTDRRGIVLLSHHQPVSDWEKAYLGTAKQLNDILPAGKTVVWFFGHEHRLAMYKKMQLQDTSFQFYPRMVGNGGFSEKPTDPDRLDGLHAYDKRVYQQIPTDVGSGTDPVGFNGFFKLQIKGKELEASYITGKCKGGDCSQGYDENEGDTVAVETFTVDASSGEISQTWKSVSGLIVPNISKAQLLML